jgi:hypothetical protein
MHMSTDSHKDPLKNSRMHASTQVQLLVSRQACLKATTKGSLQTLKSENNNAGTEERIFSSKTARKHSCKQASVHVCMPKIKHESTAARKNACTQDRLNVRKQAPKYACTVTLMRRSKHARRHRSTPAHKEAFMKARLKAIKAARSFARKRAQVHARLYAN